MKPAGTRIFMSGFYCFWSRNSHFHCHLPHNCWEFRMDEWQNWWNCGNAAVVKLRLF